MTKHSTKFKFFGTFRFTIRLLNISQWLKSVFKWQNQSVYRVEAIHGRETLLLSLFLYPCVLLLNRASESLLKFEQWIHINNLKFQKLICIYASNEGRLEERTHNDDINILMLRVHSNKSRLDSLHLIECCSTGLFKSFGIKHRERVPKWHVIGILLLPMNTGKTVNAFQTKMGFCRIAIFR